MNSDEPRQGDFNLDLDCPAPDPEECPECFSSDLISVVQSDTGCNTYTLEVSNDGACKHALSHYSVDVPCGTVSNITNTEGWKVEIGKDPTTGLNGFKIDDINGFGESSQPASFKIEFTVCHDGSSCGDSQNCWDAKIAHKAGQCVTTETIPMCISNDNPSGGNICLANAAEGGGHAAWINNYSNGSDARFQFDNNGGTVKQFPDGTGHISGTIYLPDSPEDKWEIDVWLTARKNWEEWSATGGSYKGDKDIVGDLYKTWSYYVLDVNKENRLIGKGQNDGEILLLSHYPAGYEYAVQLGSAANDKNSNYGLSIWWTFERNGKLWRGDFNFDLRCDEPDTPPECDVNELAANLSATDVSCAGAQDGRVNLEIIGGVAPFIFNWSNGASSQDISALGGGNYSVTITDANDASLQLSASVFEPSPITVTGSVSPLSCGEINGTIALDVSGGTAPYNYSWSNGSTERDLTGLNAGTYEVAISDANGCSLTESFTLLATSGISAVISSNDCKDGALTLDVMGGVPPFSYLWSTGETSKDIKATATGTYDVTDN